MITFVILAAALTLAAAAAIAVPLLRGAGPLAPSSWTAFAVLGVLVIGSAALYATLSNWSWSQPQASDAPQNMVATLARRLQRHPDDLEGWLMLGRSYVVLEETPLAIRAYERADRLAGGKSAEALLGLAEALSNQDETELGGHAGQLIEQALALAPNSPKALFFGAAAAMHRGDLPLARQRFADLLALNPPDNVKPILQQQIAAIDARLGNPQSPAPSSAGAAAPPLAAAQTGEAPASMSAGAASVRVKVALSPKLQVDSASTAPLFVFVRDPTQAGPPLAVKKLATRFPQTVELTAADAMVAGRAFASGQDVQVVARISRSGSPIAQRGDPFGEVGYHVGRDGVVDVVIDRLTP
jgi:cytochrome c-type biogenesis protein CcmH